MTGVVYRVFQRKLKMEELLRRMQVVFLEAMLHGWVGGNHGVLVPNNPGFKESVYEKDGLRVVDRYGTIEEKATGTTTIWEGGKQLWYMSYSGHYRKEDLPFLKKVLQSAYEKGEFHGGRGPASACCGDLVYTNRAVGTFSGFHGEETICDPHTLRGGHKYWGAEVSSRS